MKKPKILVVGSFVMDLIVTTNKFPEAGETVLGTGFETAPGGKGANQAVQAAKLGADVTMVGKLGQDSFGAEILKSCEDEGINTEYILFDDKTSTAIGNVQIEKTENSTENRIIVVSGANHTITAEEIEFIADIIDEYDMVILQQEIPLEINEIVIDYAYEKNIPVMLNFAPAAIFSEEYLAKLSYICPNESESEYITGIKFLYEKDKFQGSVDKNLDALLDLGVDNVLITLGSYGAAFANRSERYMISPVYIDKVLDPTGAGDSFVGAFCTMVSAGLDHEKSLVVANHIGALTVSKIGAMPSLSSIKELTLFMNDKGNNDDEIINLLETLGEI